MKKIVFMCAQPDVPYFRWQVEVMIHNFIKVGINPNWIEVLWAHKGSPSKELLDMAGKYPYVRFFYYKQAVLENFGYIPILRPDILEQHFTKFPELRGEVILYHDSDIIFRELPDFDSMRDDFYWYLSDTISYIGGNYIKSKSIEIFNELCRISNISPDQVSENESNSGGAQYLMKGITASYWRTVKEDALNMYKYMAAREVTERAIFTPETLKTYNPIQKWCADMWAVLWGAWKAGARTKISPELSFSWGTSSIEEYNRHKIMHNAGIVNSMGGKAFYKGDFINNDPFSADFSNIDFNTASGKYVEAILYAKEHRS